MDNSKKDDAPKPTEIKSFNEGVQDAAQMTELSEEDLARVAGGGCGSFSCGVNFAQQEAQ